MASANACGRRIYCLLLKCQALPLEAETKQLSPEALQASGDSEKPNTGQNGKTEGGVKPSSKLEFSDMAETLAAAMDWDKIPTTTAAEYAAAKKAADAGNPAAQFAVGAANLLGAGCEKICRRLRCICRCRPSQSTRSECSALQSARDAKGMPESPKSSYAYFKRAAQTGCARA